MKTTPSPNLNLQHVLHDALYVERTWVPIPPPLCLPWALIPRSMPQHLWSTCFPKSLHTASLVLWFQSTEDHPVSSQPQSGWTPVHFLFWTSMPNIYPQTYPSVALFLWLLLPPQSCPGLDELLGVTFNDSMTSATSPSLVLIHSTNVCWAPVWR